MAQTKFSAGARLRVTRTGVGMPASNVSVVRVLPKESARSNIACAPMARRSSA